MEWVSPWNPSRPNVTHYNVRYRKDGTNDAWKYIKGIVGQQILPINDEKRVQIAKFDHHNYLNKDYGFQVYEKIINLEGLEKETTYRLEIQAVNPSGTNKWSQRTNYQVFTTPNTALNLHRDLPHDYPPFQTIKPIVNVSANTDGGQTIEIKWLSPYLGGDQQGSLFRHPRPDVDYYNIRYRKNGTDDDWIVQTGIVGTPINDTSVIGTLNTQNVNENWIKAQKHTLSLNLEKGIEYRLEIQAHNSEGVNSWGNYWQVFTTPAGTSSQPQIEPDPLSAEIGNLSVTRHDGSPFTFDLTFSKHIPGLSFRTLRDHAFTVTDATIAGVRRLETGKNRKWRVTVNPTTTADVEITLPITADCHATGAICDGDQPLSTTSAIIVPGPAVGLETPPAPSTLTAEFRSVPVEHDGRTAFSFELHFSENVASLSFQTLRDSAFTVTNGGVTGARRLVQRSNRQWAVNVQPSAPETVTVSLPATTDCAGAGGICLPDGRKLSSAIAATILGPPELHVADATAHEGADVTLDFVVTLTRAPGSVVTVSYATSDGTATAGSDYTATRGTLTFAPGETTKTVPVPVLDDAIDEGEETMRLTISSPSGVKLGDSVATGTIENTDSMPKAWLARFGRTASVHVLDAVEERLRGGTSSRSWAQLGGYRIGPGPDVSEAVSRLAPDRQLRDEVSETDSRGDYLTLDQLLLGSAFHLVSDLEDRGSRLRLSAWGRVATSGFDGQEDQVSFDGTVTTATLGVDGTFERWLTGLAVAYSQGEGAYSMADTDAADLESTLTSLHPYAAWRVSDRVTLWGLVGYGSGSLKLVRQEAMSTDLTLAMGALGVRGEVLSQSQGLTLAIRSDALWTHTSSDATVGLVATEADASRLRVVVEGSRAVEFRDGGSLTPVLEVGLRHDGGDAEEGSGLEVGGRLGYTSAFGLSLEVSLRALVAHEAEDYEEWGASGSLRYDPEQRGLGLTASVSPSWGQSSDGVGELWSRPDTRGLAGGNGLPQPLGRVHAELGYGVAMLKGRGILTPYARVALSEGAGQAWHLGTRLSLRESLDMSLEATRRHREGERAAHDLALLVTLPW